jgi:hypothetical protein
MDRRTSTDYLTQEAERLREQAGRTQNPSERDLLLRKARWLETAAHLPEWVSSPGLQPPS